MGPSAGCFRIKTRKSAAYKLGVSVNLGFILTQDVRDGVFMRSFIIVHLIDESIRCTIIRKIF